MQGIESAIRNALTKSDSADPAMRQRIYESVWSAHERAMAANANLSDEQRTDRREKLKISIAKIEKEMLEKDRHPSSETIVTPATQYDGGLGLPDLDRNSGFLQHKTARKTRQSSVVEPDLGYEPGLSEPVKTKKRKKSMLVSLVLPVAFLMTAGFIGWSVYNSFIAMGPSGNSLLSDAGNHGPVREGDEADRNDWITIFTPTQPERISVHGRASAEISGTGNSSFIRVKSPAAGDTISFDIGRGVLDQLEGKLVTFEIMMRSDDGGTVQMSVSCDFGGLGDCARKRYDVTDQQTSLLFDMAVPIGKTINGTSKIIITSDISGTGKSLDIYAIRVKPSA